MAYKRKLKEPSLPGVVSPNWTQIVEHLRFREGYSMAGLARACQCSRQQLYTVLEGSWEPNWLTGASLLAIYEQVM